MRSAEAGLAGTFNATSPPLPMQRLLDACPGDATYTHVDEPWLVEREVGQWMELPLWIDTGNTEWARFMEMGVARAVSAGLTFRPLSGMLFGASVPMPDFRASLTLEDGSGTVSN